MISEYYGTSLGDLKINSQYETVLKIFYQCSNGLNFIHQNDIVHHNLDPTNILIDEWHNVKLYNFGFYYMNHGGENDEDEYVTFPIGCNIRYVSPERILGNHGNPKSDVWSLGLIITELVFGISLWSNLKFSQIARKILSYCASNGSVLEKIAREHDCLESYNNLDADFKNLLDSCLSVESRNRPSCEDIVNSSVFSNYHDSIAFKVHKKGIRELAPIERLEIAQVYYLWQLTGGDVHAELKKEGLIRSEAPILTVPRLVLQQSGKFIIAI